MDTLDFLSDSSSDSSNSESDNEEDIAAQTLQAAFQQQIAQKANSFIPPQDDNVSLKITDTATNFTSNNPVLINSSSTNSSINLPITKPQKVKKRPPAPDDFSKLLGIPINEAPKKKIKKLSDVTEKRIEKRAKELEDKYSWCFVEPIVPEHRTVQNPYDIDALDCSFSNHESTSHNSNDKTLEGKVDESNQSMSKSLRIGKMVAADWVSSVTPPMEDLFTDQSEPLEQNYQSNSYEEFTKKKNGYSHKDRQANKHRHRGSVEKRGRHEKRHSRDRTSHHPRLNHTTTQCPSPTQSLSTHVSTQTSQTNSHPSSNSETEKLNKPDFYKAKADDMKKILWLMSDPVSTLIVRLKLSLLEMQEAIAMLAYRLDTNAVCHRINSLIAVCRKNLEEIKKFHEINVIIRDAMTVIIMKLMSFLYHHLYIIRRDELAKAKVTLENFIMRSDHREMVAKELSSMKMYVMHMEYFAKSFNYVERANLVIKNHKSEFFTRHNFKELYPMNSVFRHVSAITAALNEANHIHDDLTQ